MNLGPQAGFKYKSDVFRLCSNKDNCCFSKSQGSPWQQRAVKKPLTQNGSDRGGSTHCLKPKASDAALAPLTRGWARVSGPLRPHLLASVSTCQVRTLEWRSPMIPFSLKILYFSDVVKNQALIPFLCPGRRSQRTCDQRPGPCQVSVEERLKYHVSECSVPPIPLH